MKISCTGFRFIKRKTSKTDCVVCESWQWSWSGEKLTTESHKKDRILISSSSFFYTFFSSLLISHASIFFVSNSNVKDVCWMISAFSWWNRLVLSKFCLFKRGKEDEREPTAAWWQHETLHGTLLCLTGNLEDSFWFVSVVKNLWTSIPLLGLICTL